MSLHRSEAAMYADFVEEWVAKAEEVIRVAAAAEAAVVVG